MRTKKLTTRSMWTEFRDCLSELRPFVTHGAFKGVARPNRERSGITYGQLPRQYWDDVTGADYVVYSYLTPIAWHMPNGQWVMPDVRYSVTTSKHQSKIRTAIGEL